jgi:uncharacterized protein YhdP
MLKPPLARMMRRNLNRLMQLVLVVSTLLGMLLAFAIIVLRYWLLPGIEQYHDRITASLASAIGSPVTIGKIEGAWEGLRPHLDFINVRILDEQGQPALVLERIEGSLSWRSLLSAELRLASLEIDKPELLIRRDAQGKFFIGAVLVSKPGDNHNLADWILHQSNMVVRDALIVWVDEQREAPPLVMRQVNLRINNLFSHHRFALRGNPPVELATPLDVRGEFEGASFDNLATWHGQLYTQLDYTDVTSWRPWLDMPVEFSSGRGALRGWLGIQNGRVMQMTADMDLHDVVTKLGSSVPELVLSALRGRASWIQMTTGFEVSTQHLSMRMQNGIVFPATNFYYRSAIAISKKQGGADVPVGELRANVVQLENLAALAKYLPMDAELGLRLDAYAPKGKISDLAAQWQGTPAKLDSYKLKGHFENLALNQVGNMPGFSGLTLDIDGSDASGKLSINSQQLAVNAPGVMREPLSFATFTGQSNWQREGEELAITFDHVAVANDDLAGNLSGSYLTRAHTLGELDLTLRLTRAAIWRAARYTPLIALNKEGNDWLNNALLAGHSEDFHLRIKGNLSDFPLDGTKNTVLEIGGHARDATLEFDKHWPRIQNASGELLIRGNRLEVKSPSATMLDMHLQNTTLTLPNMLSKDLAAEIKGEATAASNSFLKFVQVSPVRGYIDGFTDTISATGNAHLDLSMHIPLQGDKPVQVAGTVKVQDNDIELGAGVPLLRNTRGALSFTESGMQANSVSADILGGTANITVLTTAGGEMHATVKGHSNVDALRKTDPYPLLNYLQGSTAWDVNINVIKKATQIILHSNLQGLSSSLPLPFSKRAEEVMILHVEKNPVLIMPKRIAGKPCRDESGSPPRLSTDKLFANGQTKDVPAGSAGPCAKENIVAVGQDVITAQLGKLLNARLMRRDENGAMAIQRGVINFGGNGSTPGRVVEAKKIQQAAFKDTPLSKQNPAPAGTEAVSTKVESLRAGVWLTGNLPILAIQGWEGLAGEGEDKALPNKASLPVSGVNLRIEKLIGYGQTISGVHIEGAKRGDGLALQVSSSTLSGDIVWEPHGYENASLYRARLSNVVWANDKSAAESAKPAPSGKTEQVVQRNAGNLPALDIAIENLQFKGKQLGRFELVGHPEGKDWRLRRLNINNPDGNLLGDGVWGNNAGKPQTQLNLMLDIRDAGKILERFGYPNTVKGGDGRLTANLSWAGNPDDFSYSALNGTLKLNTDKGRFLKMDQGAGKLLSILSLQDLPRHIALGFTDVFSDGFQFDNINGNATIKEGVIDTQDFRIVGSSAKVTLKGNVDLNHETQNLRVRIIPSVGDSVSLIGMFAISPPVGLGLLLGNTLLGNPLDKLVSFEYNVSGTWNDPQVVKVGRGQK